MTTELCNNQTYCLNTKRDQLALLKHITAMINKRKSFLHKNFGFYLNRNKNYVFNIIPKISKNKLYLTINNNDSTAPCLNIKFYERIQNPSNNLYYFNKSKISNISRGICGIVKGKIKTTMDGTYITKLADKLNKIFAVRESYLEDDSRLILCGKHLKLKLIKLISDQQTWYEKTIGFNLVDEDIYNLAENVAKLPYKYLYDIMIDYPRSAIDGDIVAINKEELDKVLDILTNNNLTINSTLQEIVIGIFEQKAVDECDMAYVYKYVLDLPNRNNVYNNPEYNYFKDYIDLMKHMRGFNLSVKYYQ